MEDYLVTKRTAIPILANPSVDLSLWVFIFFCDAYKYFVLIIDEDAMPNSFYVRHMHDVMPTVELQRIFIHVK